MRASMPTNTNDSVKEYAQAEGVSAKLGVASELVIDLFCENRVSETAEYCEKNPRTSPRPHVDLVPGKNGILVSSAAALMTSVSSVIWGFVIY
jgi:hypothetical protein